MLWASYLPLLFQCFHGFAELCCELQVYPVLNAEEATSVDDAAVKLLLDFIDHRPTQPEDPEFYEQYRKNMTQAADNACKLLEALCTKRTSLIERLWSLYLEKDQDEFVKACCFELQPCCVLVVFLFLVRLIQLAAVSDAKDTTLTMFFRRQEEKMLAPATDLKHITEHHRYRSIDIRYRVLSLEPCCCSMALHSLCHRNVCLSK